MYLNLPGQPDGAAFDADAIDVCIMKGRTILPPNASLTYSAFVDMSGGGADDSTLCIGHYDKDEHVIVDLLMDQGPRTKGTFDPQVTVEKFAEVLKRYSCFTVTGDRYAGEWPRQAFQKCGITYHVGPHTRSQLYALLEPMLNSGCVELLDHSKLLAQLIGLVRRGEKIDHPPNEHDDFANAAAGVVAVLGEPHVLLDCWGGADGITEMEVLAQRGADSAKKIREAITAHSVWFPGDS